MSQEIQRKPIKIHWVAPNGRNYEDIVMMSLEEYENFVNSLLAMKRTNQ